MVKSKKYLPLAGLAVVVDGLADVVVELAVVVAGKKYNMYFYFCIYYFPWSY